MKKKLSTKPQNGSRGFSVHKLKSRTLARIRKKQMAKKSKAQKDDIEVVPILGGDLKQAHEIQSLALTLIRQLRAFMEKINEVYQ